MRHLNLETIAKQANRQGKIKVYTFFQSQTSFLLPPGQPTSWATFALWRNSTRIWFQVSSPLEDSLVMEIQLFSFRIKGSRNWDLCFNITVQQMSKSSGKNEFQVSVSQFFTPEWKIVETCLKARADGFLCTPVWKEALAWRWHTPNICSFRWTEL